MKNISIETLITLLEIPGMGRKKVRSLINHLPSHQEMTLIDIINIGIEQKLITPKIRREIVQSSSDRAKVIMEENDRYGIKVLSIMDDDGDSFDFDDAPILLYALGNIDCLKAKNRVAVIGSRRPKRIGAQFAFTIGQDLAVANVLVVSGLALGCDAAAHRGCLSREGQTIAFLPSGLLNIYPPENRYLAEEILEKNGCLLSEYPLDAPPKPFHFIERDRLQAGLSDFLVVSTFTETGGTLHTLKYANQYAKDIVTTPEIRKQSLPSFLKLSELGIPYEIASIPEILKKINR